MKRRFLFHTFFWCLLLGLAFTTVAQEHSLGIAPAQLEQKHDKAVKIDEVPLNLQTAAYGTNASANNTLTEFDLPGGTIVGPIGSGDPTLVQGADFGPGGVYYGTQNNTDLISIDIVTGAFSFVATITGITGGQTITGVGYDETNNIMYLGTTNITSSELYTLDVFTGAATLVGVIGQSGLITIAVDCAGNIFSADLVTDDLWSIDPVTGVGTSIGPLLIDINFCQDADFDPATGVMWFAAYAGTGLLGTVDLASGNFTTVTTITDEFCSFAVSGSCGPPCPVGAPSNPSPPTGTIDVPINGNTATWDNGAGTTAVELYFGEVGSMVQVYDGTPITSFSLAPVEPLDYSTTYGWRVVCKNDTCGTSGPTWTFTTMDDPNIVCLFIDEFPSDISQWTIVGPLGLTNWSWQSSNNAAGAAAGEMQFSWTPSFVGDSYIMSPVIPSSGLNLTISFEHFVDYFGAGLSVGAAYTTDAGATWTTIWSVVDPPGNVGPEHVAVPVAGDANFQLGFFYSGDSFQIDFWYVDDVNVCYIIPVELTSFTAAVNENDVTLNWATASELNNLGFEIQRNSGNDYQTVGFIDGHGTTTQPQEYSFTDVVTPGSYSYRLKQVDFDGTFEYSDALEVDVTIPDVFALEQNYPNPFNPSTRIDFSIAVDSKVSLKVFDILGQEVANLVNTNLVAGSHNVDFNASLLNSGVYFYRIEATGIDGTNFTNVKKMILTK